MSNNCILCMNSSSKTIQIFGRRGRKLEIVKIISQHFWFSLDDSSKYPKKICIACWRKTKLFNQFYKSVQEAHLTSPIEIKLENEEPILNPSYSIEIYNNHENAMDADSGRHVETVSDFGYQTEHTEYTEPKDFLAVSMNVPEANEQLDEITDANESEMIRRYAEDFEMKCDICEEQLLSLDHIQLHFKNQHNMNRGFLRCCGKKIKMRRGIIEHVRWHINPNVFRCHSCPKSFNEKRRLTAHILCHHVEDENLTFNCNLCDKRFARQHILNDHMKRVHPPLDQIFTCDVCQKNFKTRKLLYNHSQTHIEKNTNHICDICAKVLSSKYSLNEHLKTHSESSEFERIQCRQCSAWLKNQATLTRHMKTHTDTQQTCDICFKVKPTRGALNNHKITVHGEAKHKCTFCEKSFTRLMPLKEHIATHTGEDLYTCRYCPRTFKSNSNMLKHQRQVHLELLTASREQKKSINMTNVTDKLNCNS